MMQRIAPLVTTLRCGKYRTRIAELATIDDAAPVKKERFIKCYYEARMDELSERVIRAGWKAAGLSPYNPGLVLASSQVLAPPRIPERRRAAQSSVAKPYTIYTTPQKPQDMYTARQYCTQSTPLPRDVRTVFGKAGLQIGRLNNIIAQQQAQIERFEAQVGLSQPQKRRKKVVPKPNQKFATIDSIKAAQAQAQIQEAAATAEAQRATMDSMCAKFQLYPVI